MLKRIKAAYVAFRSPAVVEVRDALTGAMTRREFLRIADKIINRAQRSSQTVSLVMIDMDELKEINDSQGHRAGDTAIKTLAKAIFEKIRPLDICARWHGDAGDEFVILLLEVNFREAKIGRAHV
jgi:diguanylate cyclase (GGDEF)-like protein